MKGVQISVEGSAGANIKRAAALICLVFLFAGMPGCGGKEAETAGNPDPDHPVQWLEVSVAYEDGSLLPPGSVLTVTLEDVSKMAVSDRFVGETVLDVEGGPPYVTSIGFNPWLIREDHRYGVRAVIRHYKRLLYASTDAADPFGKEEAGPLQIRVTRVPRPRLIHSR